MPHRGSYADRHKAFAEGVTSGAPDVAVAIGCNPPVTGDSSPSADEIARRKALMGDLATDEAAQAAAVAEARRRRLEALESTSSGTQRGRTGIMESLSRGIRSGR